MKTIDEDALRREVADLMRHFIADYDAVVESRKRALPYMLDAHRQGLAGGHRHEPLHQPDALEQKRRTTATSRVGRPGGRPQAATAVIG